MVDEETQQAASEPAGGTPVNRDMRDDPVVLEGEIAPRGEGESAAPRGAAGAETPDHPPYVAPAAKPARASGFAAGALGGLIVSALTAGAGYYLLSPTAERAQEDANRLTGVE